MAAALLCCAPIARAQNAAEAGPFVKATWLDDNGSPCNSCLLWAYIAGSTTPQTTYTTTAGNVANTNPVVLDAAGRADVFLGPHAYKLVLEKPATVDDDHGAVIWSEDNISPLGLIAYQSLGSAVNACSVTYLPPYTGAVAMNLCTFLSSQIDVRTFGAVGVQGNCHGSAVDNQPAIQAALNYAQVNGPLDVLLPNGYCWPIRTHLWVPPGVHFHGIGRGTGYEISSAGSLLIANIGWSAANTTFPYTQMVWQTGDNFTSGTYVAANVTFASEIDHMEINCNDQVGCGNWLGVGRQEKSSIHDVVMTGGTPLGGGYGYGMYEQGVDCNGATPPASGCLLAGTGSGNPFSGQQGPDHHIEIFPSYNAPSANFILWAEMGANNYKGLQNSTLNCVASGATAGAYFWGDDSAIGPGLHMEGCGPNNFIIGNIPVGSGCNGGTDDLFTTSDPHFVIANCAAQVNLTFQNVSGGITNNSSGAPDVTISDANYFYDAGTRNAGPPGINYGYVSHSNILLKDPGQFFQVGYAGFHQYIGTAFSGWNSGIGDGAPIGFTRAFTCGNVIWNQGISVWQLGGDGSDDFSCVQHGNGGNLSFSVAAHAPSIWSGATMFSYVRAVVAGDSGHFLVGTNWLDPTTGLVVGEDTNPTVALQIHGDVEPKGGAYRVGATGNTDNAGQLNFSASSTSNSYSFIAQSGIEPVCTASLDGGAVSAYLSPLLTSPSSGQWVLTLKSSGAITANGNYVCFMKP